MDEFTSIDDILFKYNKLVQENQLLKEHIEVLEAAITKTKECNDYQELLTQKELEIVTLNKVYTLSDEPIRTSVLGDSFYFYTITFSPKRFYANTNLQQQQYILYHLTQVMMKYNTYIYGCFEHHKNTNIHAHCIIQTRESAHDIELYLNKQFNHSFKNTKCIKCDKVYNMKGILKYLHKDQKDLKKEYYEYMNNHHKKTVSFSDVDSVNEIQTEEQSKKITNNWLKFDVKTINYSNYLY